MSPPEPIIDSRNASSARLPSTSASANGARGNADFLENATDDAEAEHQPAVEYRVLNSVGSHRAGHHDHRSDGGKRHRRIEAKIGTVVSTSISPTTLPRYTTGLSELTAKLSKSNGDYPSGRIPEKEVFSMPFPRFAGPAPLHRARSQPASRCSRDFQRPLTKRLNHTSSSVRLK